MQLPALRNSQSKNLNFFDVPGVAPLTKKPEDSGYEVEHFVELPKLNAFITLPEQFRSVLYSKVLSLIRANCSSFGHRIVVHFIRCTIPNNPFGEN